MRTRVLTLTVVVCTFRSPYAQAEELRLCYESDGGDRIAIDQFRPGYGTLTGAQLTIDDVTTSYSCDSDLTFLDFIGTGVMIVDYCKQPGFDLDKLCEVVDGHNNRTTGHF